MDYKYTSLDDERPGLDDDRRGRWWLWRATFMGLILIGATLIAALSSIATYGVMTSVKTSESPEQFSCGETYDEAHQRGCKYDPLMLTWLHPKCSAYGQQEFQDSKTTDNGTWQYFEDRAGLHEIGGYEALAMLAPGTFYWTTQEQHLNHCMWMLRRIHDAAITPGKRLDSESGSAEHAQHCLDMLLSWATIGAAEKLSDIMVKGYVLDIGWTAC